MCIANHNHKYMFMRIHGRPDFAMARNIPVVARRCHIGQPTLLSMVYGHNMQRVGILRPAQLKHLI
jgi:hypothetical protein